MYIATLWVEGELFITEDDGKDNPIDAVNNVFGK